MAVGNEALRLPALQMRPRKLSQWRRYRINFDPRVLCQLIGKIDRPPINQNEIDLGMGYTAGFDCILNRCFFAQLPNDVASPANRPNEKGEVAVKMESQLEVSPRLA